MAGGAKIVESGFLTVPIPATNTVTTQIGVGTPFAPFTINATTPATLQIYVFGSTTTTPNFMPVTDINPATVKVNGVAFPGATLVQDPDTANYLNGIPDAIITISPRSSLNLASGTVIITITRQDPRDLALARLHLDRHGHGDGHWRVERPSRQRHRGARDRAGSRDGCTSPTFGANQYTPSLTALSALNYAPIPLSVALSQYLSRAWFPSADLRVQPSACQDQGQPWPKSRFRCQWHQHAQ